MLGKIISPEQSNERQMTSLRDKSKPTRSDACVLADNYRGPRGWVDKQLQPQSLNDSCNFAWEYPTRNNACVLADDYQDAQQNYLSRAIKEDE
jgi:hypothetical protein